MWTSNQIARSNINRKFVQSNNRTLPATVRLSHAKVANVVHHPGHLAYFNGMRKLKRRQIRPCFNSVITSSHSNNWVWNLLKTFLEFSDWCLFELRWEKTEILPCDNALPT